MHSVRCHRLAGEILSHEAPLRRAMPMPRLATAIQTAIISAITGPTRTAESARWPAPATGVSTGPST
jgi:hypothetical protein